MIQASANDPFGVAPHSAENAGEPDDADQHHPAWSPSTSASRPPSANPAASASR